MLLALLRSFARDRSGASAAEYALLLGVIGTGLVLASFNLGQAIASSLERSASLFASIEPSEGPPAVAAAMADAAGEESAAGSDSVPEKGAVAAAAAKSNPHNNSGSGNGNPNSPNNNGKGSGKF